MLLSANDDYDDVDNDDELYDAVNNLVVDTQQICLNTYNICAEVNY
jgi:hypothetical protein